MIDVTDSKAIYYYHLEGLGSVAALSDANAIIVEKYSYDVFGEPTIRDAKKPGKIRAITPQRILKSGLLLLFVDNRDAKF